MSELKYFGFYIVDGKVTNKNKAVCQLCKRQLSYSSTTTKQQAHLLAYHPTEAVKVEEEGRSDMGKEASKLALLANQSGLFLCHSKKRKLAPQHTQSRENYADLLH